MDACDDAERVLCQGGLALPLAAPTATPAAPGAPHLAHSLAPVPTVPSISSSAKPPAHWGVTLVYYTTLTIYSNQEILNYKLSQIVDFFLLFTH